mmetsp:Transcript_21082/g.24088  ORF Transcript_21082/g.24088 Transcript_21082/m.24088 type:complete len:591 (+) Transcript_21082:33-1805(+)
MFFLILSLITGNLHAFNSITTFPPLSSSRRNSIKILMSSENDNYNEKYAKVFSDYLIRSHEDKLKAVKSIKKQKQKEIELLEAEIKEEVQKKILSYQIFISNYMADAHQAKYKAILRAEATVSEKYETKMLLNNRLNAKIISATPPATHDGKEDHKRNILASQQKQQPHRVCSSYFSTTKIELEETSLKNFVDFSFKDIKEKNKQSMSDDKNTLWKQSFIPMDTGIDKNAGTTSKQPDAEATTAEKKYTKENSLQVSSISMMLKAVSAETELVEISSNKDVSSCISKEPPPTMRNTAVGKGEKSKNNDEALQKISYSKQQEENSIFGTKSHVNNDNNQLNKINENAANQNTFNEINLEGKNSDLKKSEGIKASLSTDLTTTPSFATIDNLKKTSSKTASSSSEDHNLKLNAGKLSTEIPSPVASTIVFVSSMGTMNNEKEGKKKTNDLMDSVEFTTARGEIIASGVTASTLEEEEEPGGLKKHGGKGLYGAVKGNNIIQNNLAITESTLAQEEQDNNAITIINKTSDNAKNTVTSDLIDSQKVHTSLTEIAIAKDDDQRVSTAIFLVIFPTLVYFWNDIASFLNTLLTPD